MICYTDPLPRPIEWHRASDPLVEGTDPWLLYPLFAEGALTVLCGEAKYAGKSTLVLNTISQMLLGGMFAARSLQWAPALILTEQPPASFRQTLFQSGALGLEELHFIHRHEVARYDWADTVQVLAQKAEETAAKYLVVDTFSGCIGLRGDEENSAGGLIKERIELLQNLAAEQNLAVLVTHHMRKRRADEGQQTIVNLSRGHSALSDTADILAALHNTHPNVKNPRRSLEVVGRFADLPDAPLELYWDHGYRDLHEDPLLEAVQLLDAALPSSFGPGDLNQIADQLGVKRDLAWEALRHQQREKLWGQSEKSHYEKLLD